MPVNRPAVLADHIGYILRTLQSSFNLEGGDTCFDQLRNQVNSCQVLWRQQIGDIAHRLHLTVNHQIVRQPAGLSTFAPVGGAPAPHFRGQTLSRIGDAQGAVHEHFHRKPGLIADRPDLLQIVLPAQNDPLHIKGLRELDCFRRGNRHLGRSVDRKIRRYFANQLHQPKILHNNRIHTGVNASVDKLFGILKLIFKYQNIKGQKSFDPVTMQKSHNLRQLVHPKIIRSCPGVELLHPKIHGISTVRHCGAHAVPIACRSEQLDVFSADFPLLLYHLYPPKPPCGGS
ncbi:hypothetical protein D3C75_688790 [compost metagenome]